MNDMSVLDNTRTIEVLLVDDDPEDVDLTVEVLRMDRMKLNISVVHDGIEALRFLRKEEPFQQAKTPNLILLDLNMPRMDGRETLEEIKCDEVLKMIPVVILTTSSSDEDIIKTYMTGASCYITKPVGLQEFNKVVKAIEDFWFTIVKFPETD